MKRRAAGVIVFCVFLLAAIVAGYWDMLNAERLRIVRDRTSDAVGEIAAIVRPGTVAPPAAPAPENQPASTEEPPPPLPAAAAGGKGEPLSPTFDILRVEPDGSTLLAGRAAKDAAITLYDGDKPLASQTANPDGEFVVVLEEPLGIGDHQLRIEAEHSDGTKVTSAETAIVSIPEPGRENELLAIVESPDRGSRLIAVPAAELRTPGPAGSEDPAGAGDILLPSRSDAAPSDDRAGENKSFIPKNAPAARNPEPGAEPPPGKPQASLGDAPTPAVPALGTSIGDPAASARDASEPQDADFAVEAVEIEDDRIFVAGRASETHSVRVYVDEGFLAEQKGLKADRFLVAAKRSLAAGTYTIRADALDTAGRVFARVEVPFAKPEGRAMSAISPRGGRDSPDAERRPPAAASEQSPSSEPSAAVARPSPTAPAADPATSSVEPARVASAGAPSAAAVAGAEGIGKAPLPAGVPLEDARVVSSALSPSALSPAASQAPPAEPADIPVQRQATLQPAASRVIIRRGDTLWRISRQTYGAGRRYTVIYLANGDQIRDPDRIYPGQVFRVPDEGEAKAQTNDATKGG